MGEAKRRKAAGQDRPREHFRPGPVRVGSAELDWVWIDGSGKVHRLTIGARIRHPAVVQLAQDAARIEESRIIRPESEGAALIHTL